MSEKRFVKTFSQGVLDNIEIWVDKQTGVNYIWKISGYAGGLSVLVDADGKPVVTPIEDIED